MIDLILQIVAGGWAIWTGLIILRICINTVSETIIGFVSSAIVGTIFGAVITFFGFVIMVSAMVELVVEL